MRITIDASVIEKVIETLKGLNVKGFRSMDSLVGLVMLFNNILRDARIMADEQIAKEQEVIADGTD